MGIATTREVERSSHGQSGHSQPIFETNDSVSFGGLLFLIPSLLQQGLLTMGDFFHLPATHFYSVQSTVITLAMMALARIKNPEQLKQCKPGELGRLIGLDRVPEVKCLRNKLKIFSDQQQSTALGNTLAHDWHQSMDTENQGFYYIDGHQRIYYGSKANLPVKYIARQKLCMSATTEYWVNDSCGMPIMMVIGQLTEKLQEAISELIIPQMLQAKLLRPLSQGEQVTQPQCTFVFDREAYSPKFFNSLWNKYGIAMISYRKNVKDKYADKYFNKCIVNQFDREVNMLLYEGNITLNDHSFREIRKLNEDGHQVAILTTHPTLAKEEIASRMFSRWTQENYFKYLISDYDFDKIVSFGTEPVDMNKEIVNPTYRKLSYKIKRCKEKIQRQEAKFYPLLDQVIEQHVDQIPTLTPQQEKYRQKIEQLEIELKELNEERAKHKSKIKVSQMAENVRYNQLKTESKKIINIIKMIAYRAETSVANIISPLLENKNAAHMKRMIVKQICQSPADIKVNYPNQTLEVTLHHLSAERYNKAVRQLAEILNDSQTKFPGTNLKMCFKTSD